MWLDHRRRGRTISCGPSWGRSRNWRQAAASVSKSPANNCSSCRSWRARRGAANGPPTKEEEVVEEAQEGNHSCAQEEQDKGKDDEEEEQQQQQDKDKEEEEQQQDKDKEDKGTDKGEQGTGEEKNTEEGEKDKEEEKDTGEEKTGATGEPGRSHFPLPQKGGKGVGLAGRKSGLRPAMEDCGEAEPEDRRRGVLRRGPLQDGGGDGEQAARETRQPGAGIAHLVTIT
ncbi:cilia- and flagella-associated protein 251-like [Entelurus aequoreus]|uniref:cilia- and flagella-associated protein 251-like n=1 Tax=Entelurus aequoreus TaxID=161455 RepID=UPI002B1E3D1A|nr:cilia- and flagella-associated protein 251-like [Entelurus aequoreus]